MMTRKDLKGRWKGVLQNMTDIEYEADESGMQHSADIALTGTGDANQAHSEDLFDIEVAVPHKLFYAFSHNRIPLVRALALTSTGAVAGGQVNVELSLSWSRRGPPPARPLSIVVDAPTKYGQTLLLEFLELRLDDTVMVDLEEAVPAEFHLTVTTSDGRIQRKYVEVQILARNQWAQVSGYEELLASYVQPNHPVTMEVLKTASQLLKQRTGSASLEGYQSGPERARQIGEAVFDAFKQQDLTYINPPASFEMSQKVRPIDEVMEHRAGTCIDLACAYASCLEQAGLEPLIWLVPGHAFAGFLTEENTLGTNVVRDVNQALNLTDAGLAVAVETIALTEDLDFAQAVQVTRQRLDPGADITIINVRRAHRSSALPLPARTVRDGIVTIIVDPGPGAAPAVERRVQATNQLVDDSVPLRITRWKSSLLDLSFRNPLLNFSVKTNGLDILVPPGRLGRIEDDLMSGRPMAIMPGDKLEGAQTAAGLRHISEVAHEITTEYYDNLGLLYTPSGHSEGQKRLRALSSRARLIQSETGANSLYLVFGTLIWQRKTAGKSELTEVRSPLFLVPVNLVKAKDGALLQIEADDEAVTTPNFCLIEKLKGEAGLDVPEFARPALDGSGIDLDSALKQLRIALQNNGKLRGARVDESAHLAILQYSQFRLWKDMDEHWSEFLDNEVVRHMVEKPGESFRAGTPSPDIDSLDTQELEVLCPVPADGAQLRAIARALRGDSFVLQGPPGTGKSQTITNLLASALARGKTVLFVAEKQAALSVVRDRLAAVGLGPYFLDLHDKGSKSQKIREQLLTAMEAVQHSDERKYHQVESTLAALHKRLAHYHEVLYASNEQGLSFATAFERSLQLPPGRAAHVPHTVLEAPKNEVDELLRILTEAESLIDVAKPSPDHPWRFRMAASFHDLDRPALAADIDALNDALAQLGDSPDRFMELLDAARLPADFAVISGLATAAEQRWIPTDKLMEKHATGTWKTGLDKALQDLRGVAKRLNKAKAELGEHAFRIPLKDAVEASKLIEEASRSFFLVRRGRTRRALQALLGTSRPQPLTPEECVTAARSVLSVRTKLETSFRRLKEAAVDPLPSGLDPMDPETYSVVERWADTLASLADRCLAPSAAATAFRKAAFHTDPVPSDFSKNVNAFQQALNAVTGQLQPDEAEWERWLDGGTLLDTLKKHLPFWREDATGNRFIRLQRITELSNALQPARALGLDEFVDEILDGLLLPEEVGPALERGLAAASLEERALVGGLDTFDRLSHGNVIRRYTEALDERQDLLKEVIPQMLLASRKFNTGARYGAVGELVVELNRKRKVMSVRQLLERFPDLLQELTPCFLMSPASVAQFIAPGSMKFDLVVFDEASQIDVAEAVGAMGRARSVVIVGDSKQMPPSRTFAASVGEEIDEISTVQANDELDPEDGESLLDEAVDSIHMDQEWLSWHYRSQDESLIAFSNSKYYDGRLSSFPSPSASRSAALSWHHVANGQFSHGAKRTNPAEAAAVVAEIIQRVNHPATAGDSIGVVTLNRQQQEEIRSRLEASGDSRVLELLNSDDEDSILVRNLENIQGQERDVMIMSTAYSKRANSEKMPLNFGPLNKAGGERRLNVAVTRARKEMLVFCSFEPEDIEEHRSKALGLTHLRDFLSMAKYGPNRTSVAGQEHEALVAYRNDVKAALEGRGLEVDSDLGLSPFKVDLAVRQPGASNWRAAILLDGTRWQSRRSPIDRDALPVNVLGGLMGWPTVLRIWLPAWQAEKAAIVDEIAAILNSPESETPELPETAFSPAPDNAEAAPVPDYDLNQIPPATPAQAPGAFMGTVTALERPKLLRDPFVPYPTEPVLGTADSWEWRETREDMRAAISDAIETEGPVQINRLAKLIGARFGVNRLHQGRFTSIRWLIPDTLIHESRAGTFVWPEGLDPTDYRDFRVAQDDPRSIEEIAPEELGNAMAFLAGEAHSIREEELFRATMELFGVKRLTSGINRHLKLVTAEAMASGRLVRDAERYMKGSGREDEPARSPT